MKEFLISFKDKGFDLTVRVNGKDEKDATAAFKQLFPKGQLISCKPVGDKLKQMLDAIDNDDDTPLSSQNDRQTLADKFNADVEEFKHQKKAEFIEKKALEQGKLEQEDWNMLCSSISPEEKKALYDEFIADADKNHKDKKAADLEKKFINYVFGVKEKGKWQSDNFTIRDLADAFGISHVRVLAIQKAALKKVVDNIAKIKHYPFKITTAEEAIALLMADNVVNPQELKLKAKIHAGVSFEDAMKNMVKMERAQKAANKAKQKADEKRYREAMKEFKKLEKETNLLRDKLGLPRRYERFFKFFAGQKLGN